MKQYFAFFLPLIKMWHYLNGILKLLKTKEANARRNQMPLNVEVSCNLNLYYYSVSYSTFYYLAPFVIWQKFSTDKEKD